MRTQKPPGRSANWETEALRLMSMPSTYAGLALLFIASTLMFMPEMPSDTKDFLMVSFACIALLPENIV